jgi:hypothetical protein
MNKFGIISLLWLILFFFCITPASAGTGDLQVTCDPGVRIFVDNVFKGVSKESDGGLFIPDLTPGSHTVKAIKKGLQPYEKEVVVKESVAVEVVIKFAEALEKAVPVSPELKKNEPEKEKVRREEEERKQSKTAEKGQQPAKEEKSPEPVKGAGQEPRQIKGEEKMSPAPQPIINEAAKPYGELLLELIVSRDTPTFFRDELVVEVPDHGVPRDYLLDAHFLDKKRTGGDITYKSDTSGRSISFQNIIAPQQGRISKTSILQLSVKEGSYTLSISRKRWKVDFYSDYKIFNKASQENIVIKRGEKLHVKIQYAPDKDDKFSHSIEQSSEDVSNKFYENVDVLLKKNKRKKDALPAL